MMVYSNTTPFIALASIDRLDLLPQLIKAKSLGLIPSFSEAAMDMQQQGIRYNKKLIARLAAYIEEDIQ